MNGLPNTWQPELSPSQLENMRLWVAELRTTKKRQAKSTLRTIGNRYCCLGVACGLLGAKWHKNAGGDWLANGFFNTLPDCIEQKLGVGHGCQIPFASYVGNQCSQAWQLNDDAGLSFKEIADVLEWAYLGGSKPDYVEVTP